MTKPADKWVQKALEKIAVQMERGQYKHYKVTNKLIQRMDINS